MSVADIGMLVACIPVELVSSLEEISSICEHEGLILGDHGEPYGASR